MDTKILPDGKIRSAKDAGTFAARQRKRQALTQADLAGLAQTGNRFISELENGKPTLQFDKVLHILDLLGLDVILVERRR